MITAMVLADPAIDVVPGATLVAAPSQVTVGCTFDGAEFTIPSTVIPAHLDKDGNPVSEQLIPVQIIAIATPE